MHTKKMRQILKILVFIVFIALKGAHTSRLGTSHIEPVKISEGLDEVSHENDQEEEQSETSGMFILL